MPRRAFLRWGAVATVGLLLPRKPHPSHRPTPPPSGAVYGAVYAATY